MTLSCKGEGTLNSYLLKESPQVLASLTYPDDFYAVTNRAIDDDVLRSGHYEATVLEAELRAGRSDVRIVRQSIALLFKQTYKTQRVSRAVQCGVVVNLLEVDSRLRCKPATGHRLFLAASLLRCRNSANTSSRG